MFLNEIEDIQIDESEFRFRFEPRAARSEGERKWLAETWNDGSQLNNTSLPSIISSLQKQAITRRVTLGVISER